MGRTNSKYVRNISIMKRPDPPTREEMDAFRLHIEDYMKENGHSKTGLYLRLFLTYRPTDAPGFREACMRMNIWQFNSLSIFEPFSFYDDRWFIFMSCAVPHNYLRFDMACEMAELLDKESSIQITDGKYSHRGMIRPDMPSRAFALELCLPSPLMRYFRRQNYNVQDISERIDLHPRIIEERIQSKDLSKVDADMVAADYCKKTGIKVNIYYGDFVWYEKIRS